MRTETYRRGGRTVTVTTTATYPRPCTATGTVDGRGGSQSTSGSTEDVETFLAAWLAGDAPSFHTCGVCGEVLSYRELDGGDCDACHAPVWGDEDHRFDNEPTFAPEHVMSLDLDWSF